jgi:RNA polymerase sigma-70 factor (ECF subfamily)
MSEAQNNRFHDPSADQQRFLSLFLKSEREIFRYVAALVPNVSDADDIVQQTAITLWEKFDDYDPERPFTPWACRFALNKTRQWIERRRRWQILLDNGLAEELEQRREELRPELEMRLNKLEGCLGKLPDEQRALIEGYSIFIGTISNNYPADPAARWRLPTRCCSAFGIPCRIASKMR